MSDGLIFLWFAWILWIIVTFFMKKGSRRTFFACIILLLICGSNASWAISGYQVTPSFVILLASLIFFHGVAQSLYLLFASFTICLGYTGILFWEQITPIWMFLPRYVLIPLILIILVSTITNRMDYKLAVGLIGITFGEIYYSLILASYSIQETIGDMAFFDMIFVYLMFLTILEILHKGKLALYKTTKRLNQPSQPVSNKVQKRLNG
ncbi:hypothetical protein WMZ97_13830 [Lentibacillus sp. N15]|uniref:YphA family membrane protein n=1 Tax=Lentibacillus songyuanensis TaxID=3136161 RepID=UPI0031B9C827